MDPIAPYYKIYVSISTYGTSRLVKHYLQIVLFGNYLIGDMTNPPHSIFLVLEKFQVCMLNFFYIPKWNPHFVLLLLHQVLSYGSAHYFSFAEIWVVALMYCHFVFQKFKRCGLCIFIYLVTSPLTPKGCIKSIKTKFAKIIFTSIFWKHFLNFHPFSAFV